MAMMQRRMMEKTNTSVPLLGLGCMRLPTDNEGNIDYAKGDEMVKYALDHGVNYFDTAYMYHGGKSETYLGHALPKYPRESYYLASKLPIWMCDTKADVERVFNDQLNKCKTEYFDFYLFHALDAEKFKKIQEFDAYSIMSRLKKEGKIKRLGFSFHDKPETIDHITDTYDFDFAQIQLNYLDWTQQDAEKTYEILTKKGIPIVVMEPVRGGFLHRLPNAMTQEFRKVNPEATNASWALRWVADHENVKVILSGMSNMEQLQDNIATLTDAAPLNATEKEAVETVTKMLKSQKTIPCTGCEYCMDCTNGVKIPGVFAIYNEYVQTLNAGGMLRKLEKDLTPDQQPQNCISCGVCLSKCPQQIKICDELHEIAALVEDLRNK